MTDTATSCEHPKRARRRGYALRLLGFASATSGVLLLGSGVFAAWAPSSATSSGVYTAANLAVQMVDANGTTFNTGIGNLLPGDFLNRYADLTNSGTVAQTFSGTVTGNGTLPAAMTVQIDTCSVAWAVNGTCSGSTSSIKAETSTATGVAFSFPSLPVGDVARARFRFKLAANADQATYQGTSGNQQVSIAGSATVAGGQDRTAG